MPWSFRKRKVKCGSSLRPGLYDGNQRHTLGSPESIKVVTLDNRPNRLDLGCSEAIGQHRLEGSLEGRFVVVSFRQPYLPPKQGVPTRLVRPRWFQSQGPGDLGERLALIRCPNTRRIQLRQPTLEGCGLDRLDLLQQGQSLPLLGLHRHDFDHRNSAAERV